MKHQTYSQPRHQRRQQQAGSSAQLLTPHILDVLVECVDGTLVDTANETHIRQRRIAVREHSERVQRERLDLRHALELDEHVQ